jgi:regulator of sigma E protease
MSNEGKQIYVNELASDMGFRSGDHIISYDDYVPESFWMLQADLAREMAEKAVVLRDNDTLNIYIDHSKIGDVLKSPGMFDLAMPFTIDRVDEASPNFNTGLQYGDRIVDIDSVRTDFVQDAWPLLESRAGRSVNAEILRGADTVQLALQVDTTGRLGIFLQQYDLQIKEYSLLQAIPAGFRKTFTTIGGYLKDLKLVVTPSTEAYKSVGSFISIGQIFPATWDWQRFLNILALLSVMLGVMNLIPIPALDGGHILFTLYEIITRRKPSDKFLEVMQVIGMILIFALMILAFGNDIFKLFR